MGTKRMTTAEIVEYTGLSRHQIDLARKQGKIPYIQFGKKVFFDPEMVDEALRLEAEENQRKAKANMEVNKPKEVIHYGKLKDLLG